MNAPPVTNFAADAFGRALASGLGNADLGGAWTVTGGAANYSVSGGVGRLVAPLSASRTASLDSVQKTATEVNTKVSLDKPSTGGGTWLAVLGRRVNASNDYRVKLKIASTGVITAQLVRTVGAAETVIQSVVVPGITYAANDVLRIRFQVSGTGTTQLSAKVWRDGSAEPATWLLSSTDTTAALQSAGSVGLWLYLSGSATQAPVTMSVDDFVAGPLVQG